MTDLEMLRAWLTKVEVSWREESRHDWRARDAEGRQTYPVLPGVSIILESGWREGEVYREEPKVEGYIGFFTLFEFDEAGALITIGAWE